MGTRLCKEWENNFPTQLQYTVPFNAEQIHIPMLGVVLKFTGLCMEWILVKIEMCENSKAVHVNVR